MTDMRQTYEVFWVRERDPLVLSFMGEELAVNGHMAIQQRIEFENEEVSPLAACDLVAYPKWAAQREHYPGAASDAATLATKRPDA